MRSARAIHLALTYSCAYGTTIGRQDFTVLFGMGSGVSPDVSAPEIRRGRFPGPSRYFCRSLASEDCVRVSKIHGIIEAAARVRQLLRWQEHFELSKESAGWNLKPAAPGAFGGATPGQSGGGIGDAISQPTGETVENQSGQANCLLVPVSSVRYHTYTSGLSTS